MPNPKEDNARMLDPQRFQIAKSMAVMPGGPMNNNPMNVTSIEQGPGSMTGVNQYPYGDSGMENAPQMGTNSVFPMQASNQPQNVVSGVGSNAFAPYGMQPQPASQDADAFESARLDGEGKARGLLTAPMGIVGAPAQPAPGGSVPSPQQTGGELSLQGVQSAEQMTGGMNMRSGKRSK